MGMGYGLRRKKTYFAGVFLIGVLDPCISFTLLTRHRLDSAEAGDYPPVFFK